MGNMKKVLFWILCLMLTASFSCSRDKTKEGDEPIPILIIEGGTDIGGTGFHEGGAFSGSGLIPFTAVYDPSQSSVVFEFLSDLGSVSVMVVNQTTGRTTQAVINAVKGTQSILISGDAGVYRITITLPDGKIYSGCFKIG